MVPLDIEIDYYTFFRYLLINTLPTQKTLLCSVLPAPLCTCAKEMDSKLKRYIRQGANDKDTREGLKRSLKRACLYEFTILCGPDC